MISALVLAAGISRRMGQPKPLVKLGAKTILQHVVAHLSASQVDEILVVLGHRAGEIAATLRGWNAKVVLNPHYIRGMSSSLQRGLDAVHPDAQAVMIVLGDQPHIPGQVIDRLLAEYRRTGAGIVVPVHEGKRGHPVIFHRRYWPELRALRGDVGGKAVLHRHARDILEVEVAAPGILEDLDHPRDQGGPSR